MKMNDSVHGDINKSNHGRMKEGGTRGQRFQTDYGRDNSSEVGKSKKERMCSMKGGPTDVSHSISGTSVKTL